MVLKSANWLIALLFLGLFSARPVFAIDTIENFDRGLSDYEFYLFANDLNQSGETAAIGAQMTLGLGIADHISGTMTLSGQANRFLADGELSAALGLFGTPLDTNHVDIDLILETSIGPDNLSFLPAIELNFDLLPDTELWGMWLLFSVEISGHRSELPNSATPENPDENTVDYEFHIQTNILIATYVTIEESHQLLLGLDMVIEHSRDARERLFSIGSLYLGYNVALNDAFELITEFSLNIPQEGESMSYGAAIGFIATMPGTEALEGSSPE
jgi:hypothetical protein